MNFKQNAQFHTYFAKSVVLQQKADHTFFLLTTPNARYDLWHLRGIHTRILLENLSTLVIFSVQIGVRFNLPNASPIRRGLDGLWKLAELVANHWYPAKMETFQWDIRCEKTRVFAPFCRLCIVGKRGIWTDGFDLWRYYSTTAEGQSIPWVLWGNEKLWEYCIQLRIMSFWVPASEARLEK